jgi:hypothetical protein
MGNSRKPKPGEIYYHFKGKLYQIITLAAHFETGEDMVVYQALYGHFKCYVRPISMFFCEVDKEKYPDVKQRYRFELYTFEKVSEDEGLVNNIIAQNVVSIAPDADSKPDILEENANALLLRFLDASSYNRKLELVTSNYKKMNNRLINDMAVSLDCTIDEGPIDQRIHDLVISLQTMSRFENRRLR